MQNIPAGKGTGLLPAGRQQSLTWHMSPSKISCGPGGSKVVMPQEAPPAWRPAGREGRAAGRRALLLSELFPHLPPLTSGLESPGSVCWRPWESCWSMCCCCADGQTDVGHVHQSGRQQPVLLALHSQRSVACYPNTSYCTRVYAPRKPGESRGKASGAERGGRNRASMCPLCCFSRCQRREEEIVQRSPLDFLGVAVSLPA